MKESFETFFIELNLKTEHPKETPKKKKYFLTLAT